MEHEEELQLCRLHTLTVVRVDGRGVWLQAGDDEAHLPLREASDAEAGEELEVFLYRDTAGMLQATSRIPLAQAGEFALLTVRSVGPHGAFLDWGLAKDLLVPYRLQPERMQLGRRYLVRVDLDDQGRPFGNGRIEECLDRSLPDLKEGEAVSLMLWQLTDMGAKVIVNNRFAGLLYRDELPPRPWTGMQLAGYIKRLREDGKLDVTLRKVGAEGAAEAREAVLAALAVNGGTLPLHDGSTPEAIRQLLGMSKKSFKKAVGGLYKEGLVTLEGEAIRLTGKLP